MSQGRLIVIGWLVCGTLDISDTLIFTWLRSRVPAEHVLQFIASGVIGPTAFQQGWNSAMLGLAIHYVIALCWVTFFVLVVRRVPSLMRWGVTFGVLYGLVMYAVMNFVVVSLTRIGPRRIAHGASLVNGVLALVLCFGVGPGWATNYKRSTGWMRPARRSFFLNARRLYTESGGLSLLGKDLRCSVSVEHWAIAPTVSYGWEGS
jgi:hypothetical protein